VRSVAFIGSSPFPVPPLCSGGSHASIPPIGRSESTSTAIPRRGSSRRKRVTRTSSKRSNCGPAIVPEECPLCRGLGDGQPDEEAQALALAEAREIAYEGGGLDPSSSRPIVRVPVSFIGKQYTGGSMSSHTPGPWRIEMPVIPFLVSQMENHALKSSHQSVKEIGLYPLISARRICLRHCRKSFETSKPRKTPVHRHGGFRSGKGSRRDCPRRGEIAMKTNWEDIGIILLSCSSSLGREPDGYSF